MRNPYIFIGSRACHTIPLITFLSYLARYADALSDFDIAFKNLRGNSLIDYKQLGLQYKLYSCEVCYITTHTHTHACSVCHITC